MISDPMISTGVAHDARRCAVRARRLAFRLLRVLAPVLICAACASAPRGGAGPDGDDGADGGARADVAVPPEAAVPGDAPALADAAARADGTPPVDGGAADRVPPRDGRADLAGPDASGRDGSPADATVATDARDGAAGDPACAVSDPFPSAIQDPAGLNAGRGELRFVARDRNLLTAYTHRSPAFDPTSGRIVFIVHGAGRNASGYLNAWRSAVDRAGALAIAPEFPEALYPSSEDFNLGVGTRGTPSSATYAPDDWRDPNDYTLSEIEHLFEAVRTILRNRSCRYFIYGHSAGGQFVHRLVTFRPDARIARAVAANPGWYTLPSAGSAGDRNFRMPYGLQGAPPDPTRLRRMFAHRLIILLGEEDTLRDSDLRTTAQADAQGQHRLARGMFYYATAQREAMAAGLPLLWLLDTVPEVGHSNAGMSPPAARHLFDP